MKLTILVLALFFLSCEKEESIQTHRDSVCVEIQSSSPFRVSGNMGKTTVTRATCAYILPGDSVHLNIYTDEPAYMTVKLYKNNKLIVYKANSCPITYYPLSERF